jgi:hypothetical protein
MSKLFVTKDYTIDVANIASIQVKQGRCFEHGTGEMSKTDYSWLHVHSRTRSLASIRYDTEGEAYHCKDALTAFMLSTDQVKYYEELSGTKD